MLVNGCRSAGQNVLDPMGFESVADGDDIAIVGIEDVQGRAIPLTRLAADVLECALQAAPIRRTSEPPDW